MPVALEHLRCLLAQGLRATASLWPAIGKAYEWIHRAAHILANHEERSGAAVRRAYEDLLQEMAHRKDTLGPLAPSVEQFQKVTASYAAGLFHCYDIPGLPRTNNDLELCFGSARYHERRATGRRGTVAGVVVRGLVRVVAAVATRCQHFSASDLRPTDYAAWLELRERLAYRQESLRAQLRFRRQPEAYLATLEEQLLKVRLPSYRFFERPAHRFVGDRIHVPKVGHPVGQEPDALALRPSGASEQAKASR